MSLTHSAFTDGCPSITGYEKRQHKVEDANVFEDTMHLPNTTGPLLVDWTPVHFKH